MSSYGSLEARNSVLLYAHPSMHSLAESIANACTKERDFVRSSERASERDGSFGTSTTLHRFASQKEFFYAPRPVVYKQDIIWERFDDGFPKLFINDVKSMAGHDVICLCSFHSQECIFDQLSVMLAIPRYLAKSVTYILPYFPTGTMERIDKEGQIATAKTLTALLSAIPLTARGPPQIMIFDIHALQERFYFSDNVIPRLETAIPLLLGELESVRARDEHLAVTIAFPDDGARKRFGCMFPDYKTIVCVKLRHEGQPPTVIVREGEPKDKHVVIVDDLVQTGGTLIECAQACLDRGAAKISCFVTHAVFPKETWRRFTPEARPEGCTVGWCGVLFENFWITDSIPHSLEIAKHKPFKLLSLATIITNQLLVYDLLPPL